jgi:hypothetical protein
MTDDIFHNCLEETFYAVSSLNSLGHTLSREDALRIKESLMDPWHFPRQGLYLNPKSAWAGVNLLLHIGEFPDDISSLLRWLDQPPENLSSESIENAYYSMSTLKTLGKRPTKTQIWKNWLLSHLLKPYWDTNPVDVAIAVLSLGIISPSSLSMLARMTDGFMGNCRGKL